MSLLILVLAGCGSVKVGQNQATEKGTIVLTVKPNGSIKDGAVSAQLLPVEATNLRVRIFNNSGANILEDVAIPTDGSPVSLQVRLPVGTYSIHIIAYKKVSSSKGIALTGGSTDGIVVQSGQNTQATISLSRWDVTVDAPTEPIEGGSNYDLIFTVNNHREFTYSLFYLITAQEQWTDGGKSSGTDMKLLSNWEAKFTKTAPSVSEQKSVYHQVEVYFPNDKYWRTGLPFVALYLPCTTAGDSLTTITVTPPDGGVIIGVE